MGVAALAFTVLLVAAMARCRRRRPVGAPPWAPLDRPLPLLMPHVSPYAYPVVHTDGSSILPDVAIGDLGGSRQELAWLDDDPGRGTAPDRYERAPTCAPEHA